MASPGMRIIFGLGLDGAPARADGLGVLRAGPRALLEFLELHAGLYREGSSGIERLCSFLAVLSESIGSMPSYAASFSADPLATARCLLDWLDEWRLQGWDGGMPECAPPRLAELVEVSLRAEGRVFPSEGERLAELREALGRGVALPITEIALCEELDEHPEAWRLTLRCLPTRRLERASGSSALCDLRNLQLALEGKKPGAFARDGSVKVLEASTALAAARYLASEGLAGGDDAMVIVDAAGSLWDEACLSQGAPRPGAYESASDRPALQLLPLAVALLRDPLDQVSLLAFLTHPLCPIGYQSRFFAEALAQDGGMGGPQWEQALGKAYASLEKYGKDPRELDALLAEWIPSRRYDGGRLSVDALAAAAKRVSAHLRAKVFASNAIDEEARDALASAVAQCGTFERCVKVLGKAYDALPSRVVDELVSGAALACGARPEGGRELGSPAWVSDPLSVVEPVRRLVWLLPRMPETAGPRPWSSEEIGALASRGLRLPPLSEVNARLTRAWMRAVSLASESLELISMPASGEAHPLGLYIDTLWPGIGRESIEGAALSGQGSVASPIAGTRLPEPRRWWKLPRSVAPDAAWRASYSQLDVFLQRPAQWVLQYKAKLRTSDILSIPDRETLTGTFAHALVERCIVDHGARALELRGREFEAWYSGAFDSLLERQGSAWLEAGAGQARLRLRDSLRRSLLALLGLLEGAGAVELESEKELSGTIFGVPFIGGADIVARTSSGRDAIVDMKYSYWLSGYRDKLAQDKDIQLTLYAELYRQMTGKDCEAAYYLIPREKLFARGPSLFREAELVEAASTREGRLGRIEASFGWRRGLLEEGRVEVVCAATGESEGKAEGPPGGLTLDPPFDAYDPFVAIYGWEDKA